MADDYSVDRSKPVTRRMSPEPQTSLRGLSVRTEAAQKHTKNVPTNVFKGKRRRA